MLEQRKGAKRRNNVSIKMEPGSECGKERAYFEKRGVREETGEVKIIPRTKQHDSP